MDIQPLSVGEVELIAHNLAVQWFEQDEPIPDFSTRYPDKLESCLQQPFTSFIDLEPYPTLKDKAAILFYLLVKNHPFLNGNKRLAVTTMLVFLAKNNMWIDTSPQALYQVAKTVASSRPQDREDIIQTLTMFISDYLVEFPNK
ncbi:MAG: type II toxin-antitoxin system death-on-curing family toxin [Candidatus Saccharibacteria bacterium]|nr:type II toxin-antitoxin system death-on-curing family toxin [Candidatus Saccharibacteria bacterium]